MVKKQRVKKLRFKRETLRHLEGRELSLAVGGISFQQTIWPDMCEASWDDPNCNPVETQEFTFCINTIPNC